MSPDRHARPAPGGAHGLRGRAPSRRCASSCAARRSGSSAPTSGATPTRTCPADFEARRVEHYRELRKPLDPAVFIDELREEMRAELDALNDGAARRWPGWTSPTARSRGDQADRRSRPQPEPRNLRRLKAEVQRPLGHGAADRHAQGSGAAHRLPGRGHRRSPAAAALPPRCWPSGCCWRSTPTAPTPGSARSPPAAHGHSEDELRYVAPPLPDRARRPARSPIEIANATFAARQQTLWGAGLDRGRLGLHPLRRLRPEHLHRVALPLRRPRRADLLARRAQVDGRALPAAELLRLRGRTRWSRARSGTAPRWRSRPTTSTPTASPRSGSAITRLLGFDLLPRIKRINKVKLYRPAAGEPDAYPRPDAGADPADPLGPDRRSSTTR